ncbi:PqqD family peptide modification chaperone [Marinitoga lauensis]|uniref:PqqD family peptide modification chaperone n=1 Tax=Marinitoga lauensis TaxID=2201189 RepID=UPI0014054B2A|nr:PqqD family peptide modification chaperone [Marinitoga lauensis]
MYIINKNIYYRYESEIDDGIIYIYNYESKEIIKSNYITYLILQAIDENKDEDEIIKKLKKEYNDYTWTEIKNYFDTIIKYLLENNIIRVYV